MRAIYESLGYILKRNIDSLANMGIYVKEIRSLGGGSKSKIWNQIKADINQVTLETVKSVEAAILAGKATGIFDSIENAVDSMVEVKDRTEPCPENKEVYEAGYQMYQKLFKDLTECFELTR